MARSLQQPTVSPEDTAFVLSSLERAISTRGGGKVMLRLDQAVALRSVLAGRRPPLCRMQEDGYPCACGMLDAGCENLVRR